MGDDINDTCYDMSANYFFSNASDDNVDAHDAHDATTRNDE